MIDSLKSVTLEHVLYSRCRRSPEYFLRHYCQVYDATSKKWVPFDLWPAQADALRTMTTRKLVVMLKARQLGFSWLVVGLALWLMIFHPMATVLFFSKRDDEAVELLNFRLKGMFNLLPAWMRPDAGLPDKAHQWMLANGSRAMALPTTGGRSHTGTLVIVDEADYVPNLNNMLNAVKPTIDAGGTLVLLSTVDKALPESTFKKIYLAAKEGENAYAPIFYGWQARPGRTQEWYEEQKRDSIARTGSLDDVQQEYPATDLECLAPRSLDKRIHPTWLQQCYVKAAQAEVIHSYFPKPPTVPGFVFYAVPRYGHEYVIGADPAEGNPTSDDSALTVLDVGTGEEVATLAGKVQPTVLAHYAGLIGEWFNGAAIMVERNNHGHAVLQALGEARMLRILSGHDGKLGWLSSVLGKAILYDLCADMFRNAETIIHSLGSYAQLSSIDGSTLRAPEGQHDDKADSYALACAGLVDVRRTGGGGMPIVLGTHGQREMMMRRPGKARG